jgi:lactate dehydrogenase-like 2-hydroxyacid dehydrogenase
LVDLDAALVALEAGQLGGVGLDVFENETAGAPRPVRSP